MKKLIVCILPFLIGCQTVDRAIETNPTVEVAVQIAAQYATQKFILAASQDGQARRASEVRRISDEAKAQVEAGMLPLDELEKLVVAQIPADRLDAADRLLLQNLILLVRTEIQRRVKPDGTPLVDEKYRVVASKFLGWISEAASVMMPRTRLDHAPPMLVGGVMMPQVRIAVIP